MTSHRPADAYTNRARKEGFAARSIYKLEEIQRRTQLLKPGFYVLDLGASPGSWVQFVAPKVGAKGRVVAVDLNPLRVTFPAWVTCFELDVLSLSVDELTDKLKLERPYDVLLSDMAPHTTGIKDGDYARSEELVIRAIELADRLVAPNGKFVAKIFQGPEFENVRAQLRKIFKTVRVIKPEASRKTSPELYLVGLERKS